MYTHYVKLAEKHYLLFELGFWFDLLSRHLLVHNLVLNVCRISKLSLNVLPDIFIRIIPNVIHRRKTNVLQIM